MQHRGTRLAILCLLLAAGALAGYVTWTAERRTRQLDEQRDTKVATIDRLLSSIASIATTQQAYAEYGRRDVGSLTRVSRLVDRITTDAAGLRAAVGSTAGNERLEEFWTSLSALMSAESRGREQLAGGDDAGAAETLLASTRAQVTALTGSLAAFRQNESDTYRSTRRATVWREWMSLTAVVALWAMGLVAFALWPSRRSVQAIARVSLADPAPAATAAPSASSASSMDLSATAALAVDLARLADQRELPALLARVADVLKARGVIVWIGAGAELFAVAAHGYDGAVLGRIRPIARDADNATAAAWRTGTLRRVAADASGYGALVAPMVGPMGCAGVLAVEVDAVRERDDATHAVAMILASQLSGVLAAWPAASTTELDGPLDRKAAS
jgi:hypothetical protein